MNDADDSDSDDESKNKSSDATAKPAAAAQTPSAAQLAKPESKSELTNRLKNLYNSTPSKPTKMATALPPQSNQMNVPAANTQPVAVAVPTLAPPKPQQQLVPSPTSMAPPRTTNPAASQQGVYSDNTPMLHKGELKTVPNPIAQTAAQIGRMPAALPKAR